MAKRKLRPPVRKNEEVMVECEDFTHEGNGVAKLGHYPIFIPYLLPGERARIKVVKVNKHFAYGKLLSITSESKDRVTAPCPVFDRCGGCQLQHMTYESQLEMKRQHVKNSLSKIGKLIDPVVHPVLGMESPWRYRNKIQMPVGEKDGQLITGFYRERSHDIIPDMKSCLIQNEYGDRAIQVIRQLLNTLQIKAYDEVEHRGVLRHIIVRTAYETDETMVILVTKTKELPKQEAIVEGIKARLPKVSSIVHNVNPQRTNVILGRDSYTLYGKDYIEDSIGPLRFKLSAKSFFQVNPTQTKRLYEQVMAYAQLEAEDIVIDAYCGIGSISLFLAQKAKKVYGVEVVAEAIEDARENARLNGLDNVEFVCAKAEEMMPKWKASGIRPNVIVVDPPRKGCDERLLQAMLEMKPERIVYVSCHHASLARDLRILEDGGYSTVEVQPVDMFSQTYHVESVALLKRQV